MSADVVLVRHAQAEIPTPDGPDDLQRPLTETGRAQAKRLVAELVQEAPGLIIASPYSRAVRTVAPTARALGLPVATDHELREWDSGLEPTPDYARHYAFSWANPELARPGGESLRQLRDRAVAVLTSLARQHRDRTVIVGGHGTFIARALVGFGRTEVDWPFSHAMPSPAIYRLRFTGHGVRITGPGLPG